jgi:hypothetical protein
MDRARTRNLRTCRLLFRGSGPGGEPARTVGAKGRRASADTRHRDGTVRSSDEAAVTGRHGKRAPLQAPVQAEDGTLVARGRGTPQGGVISPLLANIFLPHVFDTWMGQEHPDCPPRRQGRQGHCRRDSKLEVAPSERSGVDGPVPALQCEAPRMGRLLWSVWPDCAATGHASIESTPGPVGTEEIQATAATSRRKQPVAPAARPLMPDAVCALGRRIRAVKATGMTGAG